MCDQRFRLNKWMILTTLLMSFLSKTGIVLFYCESVIISKAMVTDIFWKNCLNSTKTTTILLNIAFTPLVQISTQWKKHLM